MKNIILAFSVLFASQALAQITITSANMPSIGDTLRFSNAALEPYVLNEYRRGGPNQVWNFDTLRVIGQSSRNFISPSQTPYNSVPTNRIGILFADTITLGGNSVNTVYNFINSSASDFSVDYRAASIPTGIPILPILRIQDPYSDKDELFQFPLNFNDRDSSTFNFVYTFTNPLASIYYGSSGYRINDVDAWGRVSTPYGTFNALRIVTDMVSLDTINALGQDIGIPSHVRQYQWLTLEEKIPVMEVNGVVNFGVFVPNQVQFRDIPRGTGRTQFTEAKFNTSDTVTQANTTVSFTNNSTGSSSYQWDFTPNRVRYETGSNSSRDISVSFLDTGKFTVRLIVSEGYKIDTLERVDYISVNQGVPIVEFELENDSTIVNEDFVIQNISQFGDSFSWSVSPSSFEYRNGTSSTSADSIVLRFSKVGFYAISLSSTNASGTRSFTQNDAVKVHFPVGIQENSARLDKLLTLSPNPASKGSEVTLQADPSLQLRSIQIFDTEGKLIRQQEIQSINTYSFALPEVAGIYFFKVETNKGSITKKVIVE
jgi:hypothetical protein